MLNITDSEFANDDLQKPNWYKIKDIQCKTQCYVKGSTLPIKNLEIPVIQKAITVLLGANYDYTKLQEFLSFSITANQE